MTKKVTQQEVEQTLARLLELGASDRLPLLVVYLQEQVAQALGINPSQLDPQQPLNYLGLDSLIAVKLRNRLRTDLKVDIVAVKFMEDANIADLATQVSEQLTNQESASVGKSSLSQIKIAQSNNDELLEGEI